MKTVFMFSGQGAQYAGMGKDLYENYAVAKEVFDRADEVLGYSIKDICFSDEEKLGLTEFTQPAILTMSIAAMKVLQENGINADMTAGLSLGEYSALVASGAMRFEEAVALVQKRGKFMSEAVPAGKGGMFAIIGLDTALVEKAAGLGRTLVLGCKDPEIAKAALAVCKDSKPVLNGADASNYEAMNAVATEAGVVLGVSGKDLNELYDTTAALEKLGNKNLVLDTTGADIKETFANTVQVRRAALKDQDRTFGYPSIVNLVKIAKGDLHLQAALASMFTMKYGSIIVMEQMTYAEALPLYGLRQNVFTDPQKPMKVEPGTYPLNGADENAVVVTTVDFALTYFVVSGELERSGVPLNLVINDAGGLSVLTSWAAGKFSGNSISSYIKENVEPKVKSRKLIIPGKVAVLKGDLEAKLPGWEIIVGPREAVQLVKFLKDLDA